MCPVQIAHQRRNVRPSEPERGDDTQISHNASRLAGHSGRNGVDPLEKFYRFLEQALPFVRQRDASCTAHRDVRLNAPPVAAAGR